MPIETPPESPDSQFQAATEAPESPADRASAPPEVAQLLEPLVRPGRLEEAAHVVQSLLVAQSHSGPLPPAREMRGYEGVLPGSADRILMMAEREQAHRQELEATVVRREGDMRSRGQLFALTALIVMLLVVAYFVYANHPQEGAALGGAVILGVVALFLGQRFIPAGPKSPNADDKD